MVDKTEDAGDFNATSLAQYDAVVFLMTTGDVLDDAQQSAFEQYIQAGGGYVGIHSASDTEYDWPWYGDLMGAFFDNHPQIQEATINVEDKSHPSTKTLSQHVGAQRRMVQFSAQPAQQCKRAALSGREFIFGRHNGRSSHCLVSRI